MSVICYITREIILSFILDRAAAAWRTALGHVRFHISGLNHDAD
jgi:hypothetical protein